MNLRHTRFFAAITVSILSMTYSSSFAASANICEIAFKEKTAPPLMYELQPGRFQFSYEAEYLFDESGTILRDYAPDESEVPQVAWLAMSDADRIAWVRSKFSSRPEHAVAAGLHRIAGLRELPDDLIVDATGNLELVINPPQSTYAEWESIVETIVNRYGPGSQQAMVSKPREEAFTIDPAATTADRKNLLGWLVYTNLFDTFEKLRSGAERFQADPTKPAAQSFDHPFLGPMIRVKRDALEKYLKLNSEDKNYDDASKKFVRKSDASFKYTSGPSYRPDIAGPARWSWEIRNAHKDLRALKAKVVRDVSAHVNGLDAYASFASVPAFDSVEDFENLPTHVQHLLERLFPSKADKRFRYSHEELVSLEMYRNFAFPEADFKHLARVLSPTPQAAKRLIAKIKTARLNYIGELSQINAKLAKRQINHREARIAVMGSLAMWSIDSGLADAFENAARSLNADPRYTSTETDTSKKAI